MGQQHFAFCASTGRTATMFLASALNNLSGVIGLHEGHAPGEPPTPLLPLINLQNRKSWYDSDYAEQTVTKMRDTTILSRASGDASLLVDVAFYNAPLLRALARQHPGSKLFAIFRRCEGFVRSATIVSGEDLQPAGWPDRSKPLTDREKFISLGRLKPRPGSDDSAHWSGWSAIQRNIWLWHSVNSHLLQVVQSNVDCNALYYEDLVENPEAFWTGFLHNLGLLSESNLADCVDKSSTKINRRRSYEVGPVDTWNKYERALYEQIARPLERKLYD